MRTRFRRVSTIRASAPSTPGCTRPAASTYLSATDQEALDAFQLLTRLEGIIPALESAHAIAKVTELAPKRRKEHLMVVNLSGRGDKDIPQVAEILKGKAVTTRIDTRFADLKREGRAAFVTYVMCGDPDIETSLAIIKALPSAGADMIEIGMPFTDPMADGPSIQAAGLRALKAGTTLKKTLDVVRRFREGDDKTPIVLMGYYNPIYIHGVDKFLSDAKTAGVDGLILVDMPPEEDDELCIPALKAGLNFIRLATPTTDDKRLPAVLANTSGFVYYVSITGITGSCVGRFRASLAGRQPHQAPHAASGVCRLRHPHAGSCADDRGACGRRGGRHRAGRCDPRQPRCTKLRDAEDGRRGRRHRGLDRRRRARRAAGRRIAICKRKVCVRRHCPGLAGRPYKLPAVKAFQEPFMNWISNVVRPKIRSILNRRETSENLWIKCPDTGQLVYFKDVEANQFVIPNSNYHMRMSAAARLKSIFDNETWYDVAVPPVAADPLKFRDERRYVDRIKDARAKTGMNDSVKIGYGKLEGDADRRRRAGFRFHGRLARHGRRRSGGEGT